MKTYYKDYNVTASIADHKDGTATLTICAGSKRTARKYASRKSAYSAWRRFCR